MSTAYGSPDDDARYEKLADQRRMEIERSGHELVLTTTAGGRRLEIRRASRKRIIHYEIHPPLDVGLYVTHSGSSGSESMRNPHHSTDRWSHDRYDYTGDEAERVAVFREDLRFTLQSAEPAEVTVNDRSIVFHGNGDDVADANAVRRDLGQVESVASGIDRARARCGPPAPLAAHEAAWRAAAAALKVTFETCPMSIRGEIDGVRVHAWIVRHDLGRFGLVARASLAAPLGLGLAVRPRRILDGVGDALGGHHVATGDREFERVLHARAERPDQARPLFDDAVRAALRMLPAHGDVHVSDEAVVIQRSDVGPPPALPDALPHLVSAARAIDVRRHAGR